MLTSYILGLSYVLDIFTLVCQNRTTSSEQNTMQMLIKADKSNWCHLFQSEEEKNLENSVLPLFKLTEAWLVKFMDCFCCFLRWEAAIPWLQRAELLPVKEGQQSHPPSLFSKLLCCGWQEMAWRCLLANCLWPDVIPQIARVSVETGSLQLCLSRGH